MFDLPRFKDTSRSISSEMLCLGSGRMSLRTILALLTGGIIVARESRTAAVTFFSNGRAHSKEESMLKTISAGIAALAVITASSLAYAQGPSGGSASPRVTAADLNAVTDARIGIIKAA